MGTIIVKLTGSDTHALRYEAMANEPLETGLALAVLHVDDDSFELDRVKAALKPEAFGCCFTVDSFDEVEQFRQRLKRGNAPDLVLLDIHFGQESYLGVTLAAEVRKALPSSVIIMCSTADDIRTIAKCLAAGADDFISKHSDRGELSLRIVNSYRLARLKRGLPVGNSQAQPNTGKKTKQLAVGATANQIAARIPLIINSAITAVHIAGESGTGKEMVSDLFAAALPTGTPFIKVNCGAIAPTLLESELFGHVKGSFTGAQSDRRGFFEAASGGFIFLDEVATLSPTAQIALLRVLENREVLRVGGTQPVAINVRVLSATNEDLIAKVKDGKFRQDLWQRLCEAEIRLAPLRDRRDEIEPLVHHFLKSMPGGPYEITAPALEVLCAVSWTQGNIRELRNCLRAMTELNVNKLLTPLSIPARIWEDLEASAPKQRPAPKGGAEEMLALTAASFDEIVLTLDGSKTFDTMIDELLLAIVQRLAEQNGKISLRSLSKTISLSRSTLSDRLKGLVVKNMISLGELSNLVGIADK